MVTVVEAWPLTLETVTVCADDLVTVLQVPCMIPVLLSILSPAGSGGLTEYLRQSKHSVSHM